jgi:hypothetical protein
VRVAEGREEGWDYITGFIGEASSLDQGVERTEREMSSRRFLSILIGNLSE